MNNKKLFILAAITMLAVGFATVSTVLYINGTTKIKGNSEDFENSIIFTSATTETGGTAVIEQSGKEITYTSKTLKVLDETTPLNFIITNLSKNYDATATISCVINGTTLSKNDNIELILDKNSYTLASGGSDNGLLTTKLIKNVEEAAEYRITCTILATAVERGTAGTVTLGTNNTLSGTMSDALGTTITSGYLAVYSNTMKVATISSTGEVNVSGLVDGVHEVYYMGSTNPTGMTIDQVEAQALAKGTFATSRTNPIVELEKGTDKFYITRN